MNTATSSVIAILAIGLFGLLFGILMALVGVMAYALHRSAVDIKQVAQQSADLVAKVISQNTQTIDKLRGEVALSLSRMDADRLHDAATQIQTGAKALGQQTATLSRLIFAAAGQSALAPGTLAGFPDPAPMDSSFSMEDEALDDATMLAERTRWQRGQAGQAAGAMAADPTPRWGAPPPSPLNIPLPDAFAGLTENQIKQRIAAFYERRRNGIVDPVADQQVADLASRMDAPLPDHREQAPLPDFSDSFSLDSLAGHAPRGEMEE